MNEFKGRQTADRIGRRVIDGKKLPRKQHRGKGERGRRSGVSHTENRMNRPTDARQDPGGQETTAGGIISSLLSIPDESENRPQTGQVLKSSHACRR